jgi:general secretion pathway protein K
MTRFTLRLLNLLYLTAIPKNNPARMGRVIVLDEDRVRCRSARVSTMAYETQVRDADALEPCRGFILLAVLWIIGALATLAMIYALYVHETFVDFVEHDERLQAQALAISGVELAIYQLTKDPNTRPVEGQFTFVQGNATVAVTFSSENSRIDLNLAPRELIEGLLTGLGVQPDEASSYTDRIVAWRTPLKTGQSDAEEQRYQEAGKTYGPRHGPFQHPEELALVADMPGSLFNRIMPYVTVYSGRPEVNVLAASPQVLAALPEMTPDRLQLLLALRQAGPQAVARAQLGAAASSITLDDSRTNRVAIDIQFDSGRRMHKEAVVMLMDRDSEPYRIVWWSDRTPPASDSLDVGIR